MTGRQIAVTGLGMVTPAGSCVDETWRRVCEGGTTEAAPHPGLVGMPVDFCASVGEFDTSAVGRRNLYRLDRFVQFMLAAAHEAVTDAGLSAAEWDGPRVGVVIGCGMGGVTTWEKQLRRLVEQGPQGVSPLMIPMVTPSSVAGEVALALGVKGPSMVVSTACASGATAIVVARDLLASGQCDIVITGGTEAANTPLTVSAFANLGTLSQRCGDPARASRPFDADRDGFVMAEGAAVLVLERAEHAAARGRRPRALLAGCGSASEAHHPTAPHPEGVGASQALKAALRNADLAAHDIDHVNAHGTSTVLNDHVEARVISRMLPHGPLVTSTKGVLGHMLGAAGAVEAALTVLAMGQSTVPPTANLQEPAPGIDLNLVSKTASRQPVRAALSNSFGFGGHNVVLAFRTT
ncbi:beta-ketoacyl-[acyl-carrier-protein] synthase family protein [Streptomyces sp. NPDC048424]|uniref:beta-ketoacyl-[acyl-carrier-protein] synthase family protein n=1 Tax=Streptomyces sp. NPDC048424 TaxID=3155265 RepID=UPI0034170CC1